MLSTLIAALLGLGGSAFPEVLKFLQDKRDKTHELEILKLQLQQQAKGYRHRLEEIGAWADIEEVKTLSTRVQPIGVAWVDALNGTVRPVLAYGFFLLYAGMKLAALDNALPWKIWTEFDEAIFAAVISYYFGQRALGKVMGRVR